MKKQKEPEMFAEEESEQEEHEELKNYFRLELVKTEKDRTRLN